MRVIRRRPPACDPLTRSALTHPPHAGHWLPFAPHPSLRCEPHVRHGWCARHHHAGLRHHHAKPAHGAGVQWLYLRWRVRGQVWPDRRRQWRRQRAPVGGCGGVWRGLGAPWGLSRACPCASCGIANRASGIVLGGICIRAVRQRGSGWWARRSGRWPQLEATVTCPNDRSCNCKAFITVVVASTWAVSLRSPRKPQLASVELAANT